MIELWNERELLTNSYTVLDNCSPSEGQRLAVYFVPQDIGPRQCLCRKADLEEGRDEFAHAESPTLKLPVTPR